MLSIHFDMDKAWAEPYAMLSFVLFNLCRSMMPPIVR